MLDLQLPKIDGTEVLAVMQEDPELRAIPVVVLTVTDYDKEMLSSLGLPATCCVVKPLTVEKYLDALRCYSQFGLAIVRVNPSLD
jgi:CheY-like chemotaxis protein